ncbi:hypothetical protein JOM56_007238 [Amanita muscaria]
MLAKQESAANDVARESSESGTKRKRRWDVTEPNDEDVDRNRKDTDATPADARAAAVTGTPKRSHWDQTPAPSNEAPTSIIMNAPGIMHEDKHSRYLTDEELDAILPSSGYVITTPRKSQAAIYQGSASTHVPKPSPTTSPIPVCIQSRNASSSKLNSGCHGKIVRVWMMNQLQTPEEVACFPPAPAPPYHCQHRRHHYCRLLARLQSYPFKTEIPNPYLPPEATQHGLTRHHAIARPRPSSTTLSIFHGSQRQVEGKLANPGTAWFAQLPGISSASSASHTVTTELIQVLDDKSDNQVPKY